MATRLEMVESAREMITKAYMIDSLDPAFPHVLGSVIEGKGLYEHSIGEFFELYGRFEEKYQLKKPRYTRDKMASLVDGDERYLKQYKEYGKWGSAPMPYAVRNILAHAGTNPNKLDPGRNEIRTSDRPPSVMGEWQTCKLRCPMGRGDQGYRFPNGNDRKARGLSCRDQPRGAPKHR